MILYKIMLSIISIGAALIAFVAVPWLLLYVGLSLGEDPPKPANIYGEFPFYLEYEINGQVMKVEDKVLVKYDGFSVSEGSGGKYVKWKQTLDSGNKEVVLFKDGESVTLIFTVRSENYHLEDIFFKEDTLIPSVIKEEGRITSHNPLSDGELLNNYKLKLIRFEYGESFKK